MIFATCGSSGIPFRRMMLALRELPPAELHVQHGPVPPPPCARAYPYLPFGDLLRLAEQADVYVSHAGVGSILCALRTGRVPIVFPRLKRYGEMVDDQQVELAEALEQRGAVVVAHDAEQLLEAVSNAPSRTAVTASVANQLSAAVRAAIGEPARAPSPAASRHAQHRLRKYGVTDHVRRYMNRDAVIGD